MRVLVLGAAVSGQAAARLAQSVGNRVVVFDGTPGRGSELLADGISVVNGDWDPGLLEGIDTVVTSPGFSIRSTPCVDAFERGVPLVSELEFGARHLSGRLVAITGTNGKTTVTELTAAMLDRGGIDAVAAGNIGLAVSEVARFDQQPDVVVVEASSFQLATISGFHPEVSVILNIAPDHLDWHGSFEAYAAAKMRIAENQAHDDLVVFGADDPEVVRRVASLHVRRVPVSGLVQPEGGVGPSDGVIRWEDVELPLDMLARRDAAFLVDVAAALVSSVRMGADGAGVAAAAAEYEPAAHRRRVVATRTGISYVDDSKATNPHAALAAVAAYPSVVLIAGGRNKGLDLSDLVTADNLVSVITLGEAAEELERAATVPTRRAESMDEAVAMATTDARPGTTVLLAPGCASFDMFENYAARGDAFVRAVQRLMEAV